MLVQPVSCLSVGWRKVKAFLHARQQAPKLLDVVAAAAAAAHKEHESKLHADPPVTGEGHTSRVTEPVTIPPVPALLPSLGVVSEGGPLTLRFMYTFRNKVSFVRCHHNGVCCAMAAAILLSIP